MFDRACSKANAGSLPRGRTVGVAVVLIAMSEIANEQFVDGQIRERTGWPRHCPMAGLEFAKQPGVLGLRLLRAVASK